MSTATQNNHQGANKSFIAPAVLVGGHDVNKKQPVKFVHNTKVPFSINQNSPDDESIEMSSSYEENESNEKKAPSTPSLSSRISGGDGSKTSELSSSGSVHSDDDEEERGEDSSTILPQTQVQSIVSTQEEERNQNPSKSKKRTSIRKRKEGSPHRKTISELANLQLPVGRVSSFVKAHLGDDAQLSLEAKIMLTAELQHLLKDLTLIAIEKKNNVNPERKTITREDLKHAIKDSPLFCALGEGLMIPTSDSGVVNLPLTKKMKREVSLFKRSNNKSRRRKLQNKSKEQSDDKKTSSKNVQKRKPAGINKRKRTDEGRKKQNIPKKVK